MAIKILILITFIISQIFSLEITISPSKNKKITEREIQIFSTNLQKKRGIIIKNKEKIKEKIAENRLLADKYIQNQTIPLQLIISHKQQIERELADLYVRENIEKKISDKEVKSYYIMHQNQFKEPKKLTLNLYDFENFNKAIKAYKEKNFTSYKAKKLKIHVNKITPYLRPIFSNLKKDQITPPLYFRGKFIIFKVENIEESKVKPLKKVAKEIRKILLQKAYITYREKLLEKLKK